MTTSEVADGLAIRIEDGEWRLTVDRLDGLTLLSATAGAEVLRYRPEFARARHLPPGGELPVDAVEEVVVGWSQTDGAWHLGLLLGASVAEARGGRWCALARWLDPAARQAQQQAHEAGALLADTLGRPFRFVAAPAAVARDSSPTVVELPPDDLAEAVSASVTARTAREPITLPLRAGDWRLRAIDLGLQWEHVGVWSLGNLWSILGRVVLGLIFVIVSVLTLRSPYAVVEPVFLPYVGLVIGAGLIVAALIFAVKMLRMEVVVFDCEERQVRRHFDLTSDVLASYEFDEIQAVVVTQIAQGGRQRGKQGQPDRMAHEAWLHLLLDEPRAEPGKARDFKPEDAYVTIGYIDSTEGEVVESHFEGKRGARVPRPLPDEEATTAAQQVAVTIARALGVEAYVDQR